LNIFKMQEQMVMNIFVIVNNDFQRALTGSKEFQDEKERVFIVENLRVVDKCFFIY
jgi:D-beta-D-heptose 7-phosphate kinase/D-beta-D-heptose 1-phosphate adenosyltransferase